MRTLVIVGLVCAASVASAGPKQKVAVLGLEPVSSSAQPDKATVTVAQDLTVALRLRVKAGQGSFVFAPGSEVELLDEKLLENCENEAPACMSMIASKLGADVLVYGKLERKPGGFQISLRMLDAGKKKVGVTVSDLVPTAEATGVKLQAFGRKLWSKLDGSTATVPTAAPSTTAATTATPGCDSQTPLDKGNEQMTMGNFGPALVLYEKAHACNPSSIAIIARAFMASCKVRNTAKAKLYFGKLPADKQQSYASICTKQAIDVP